VRPTRPVRRARHLRFAALLDGVDPGETFDFIDALAAALPIIVIAELLGVRIEDRDPSSSPPRMVIPCPARMSTKYWYISPAVASDSCSAYSGSVRPICLGANLARLEARVMFEDLLARYPSPALDGDVQLLRSTMIRGIKHMPVRLGDSAPA
jgi:cytochrome P450